MSHPTAVDDRFGYYDEEFVVTVAATGGVQGKETNPHQPVDHQEIAEQLADCYDAGASIGHVHARDEEGKTTPRPDRWEHLIGTINDECPELIVQLGGLLGRYEARAKDPLGEFLEHRMEMFDLDPAPDMITVNAGTFDVLNDPEWGEVLSPNSQAFNREFIREAQRVGYEMEFEIWHPGQLYAIQQFFDEGLLDEPVHVTFITIYSAFYPAHLKHLSHYLQSVPFPVASWQPLAIGRASIPTAAAGLTLGSNVRVGMEDAVKIDKDNFIEHNRQLVERVVQVGEAINRRPKPTADVRAELGLD